MEFINTFSLVADASGDVTQDAGLLEILMTFLPFVLLIGVLYFMMIRPQRKKEKKMQAMRESLQVGDEVTTNGGIIGRVVSVKEDTVLIETGSDRSKVRIKKWAIAQNETIHDDDIS